MERDIREQLAIAVSSSLLQSTKSSMFIFLLIANYKKSLKHI